MTERTEKIVADLTCYTAAFLGFIAVGTLAARLMGH